ncbi:MAG: hypothetical protein H6R01_88 [Burkholderiaceae bacterium]|nr:hypothetical protein [Burkholderiaceae bacterium]
MIGVLDVKTVSFVGMVAGICLSAAMVLNWQVQKRQPGVAWWAFAWGCGSLGLILSGLRYVLPDFLSIVLGNVLLDLFVCLVWLGIRQFVGKSADCRWWCVLLLLVHFCYNLYFVIATQDIAMRVIGFCAFHIVLSILCIAELLRDEHRVRESLVHTAIGAIFLMHVLYNFVRIVLTVQGGAIPDLMTAGPIHRFAFVEGVVLSVMLASCLIIVSNQRLRLVLEEHQQKLEAMAMTDTLSGLSNRRHFIECAAHEIERARRYSRPLALVMFDIDHFKNINDSYGHQCGDEVIKSIGHTLRAGLREQDIISRIGGEEFAILMPETSGEKAIEAAERLRELQQSARTTCADDVEIGCTASFGVTELNAGDASIYDMLPRADKAMYAAKNAGRNCVVSAENPAPVAMRD